MNQEIKSISAVKKYPRARTKQNVAKARGRQIWKVIQSHGDDLIRLGIIAKESNSSLTRMVLMTHLTPLEGEAGKRYAFVIARFERFHTDTRRNTKSPSYERAFGSDMELKRHEINGTTADYQDDARFAKKEYEKLMRVLAPYGPRAKSMLDDLCCSDIEPSPILRANLAVVLRQIAKGFGVSEPTPKKPRRVM